MLEEGNRERGEFLFLVVGLGFVFSTLAVLVDKLNDQLPHGVERDGCNG